MVNAAPPLGRRGSARGRALVIGYALSGRAAAACLVNQGWKVVVLEDDIGAAEAARADGVGVGVTVEMAPGPVRSAELGSSSGLVVPSPGVRADHPAVSAALAAGVDVWSEVELAWRVLDEKRQGASWSGPLAQAGGDHWH